MEPREPKSDKTSHARLVETVGEKIATRLQILKWHQVFYWAGFDVESAKRFAFLKYLYSKGPEEFAPKPEELDWASDLKENNSILNNLSTF